MSDLEAAGGAGGELHAVLPNDIDDPATPSGGNIYDRRVLGCLVASGWCVREHPVPGAWPQPSPDERAGLARELAAVPDGGPVLLDGLVASAVPEVLVPEARRLRQVVLVHMPLGDASVAPRGPEREVLATAAAVITPSEWTRRRLLDLYALPADRLHAATPGVDPAPLAGGSAAGRDLICVGALTPQKGHDVLVHALAAVADLPWTCVCVGAVTRDPAFVEDLRRLTAAYGLAQRVHLVGPRTGDRLHAAYAAADLLVLASRGETYGMVVTEALARGIPVLATAANGLPEALGHAPDGSLPGLLVPPGDPDALAGALRAWLTRSDLRERLRRSARGRRTMLTGWESTARTILKVLDEVRSA